MGEILRRIGDMEWYEFVPYIAFLVTFIAFIYIVYRAVTMRASKEAEMARKPLEEQPEDRIPADDDNDDTTTRS